MIWPQWGLPCAEYSGMIETMHTTTPPSRPRRRAVVQIPVLALMAAAASAGDPDFSPANTDTGVRAKAIVHPNYAEVLPDIVVHPNMVGGACVGDFNADTYPDLFIPGLGSNPDELYINNQDGTFSQEAAAWGVDDTHLASGTAAGDVNNDGYTDLYVTSYGPPENPTPGNCRLYLNNGPDGQGAFSFTDVAAGAGVNRVHGDVVGGMGAAFGDIDLDGDLDLFVASWADEPGGNRLYENQFMQTGAVSFVDITDESLSAPQRSIDIIRGFTPHFADLTGDRYPELLLTADFRTSQLYVNNGVDPSGRASYRTVTEKANILFDNNGMGAAIADFNGDQRLDWFMTNIFIAQGIGNTLYMNTGVDQEGDPIFSNQSTPRGVVHCGWGWGVLADDFDNDRDQDMIAVGGWPNWILEQIKFWANDGDGFFTEEQAGVGLDSTLHALGIASMDFDKDMDLDIVIVQHNDSVRFYRNDMDHAQADTSALRVRLDTSTHPCLAPSGRGAEIRATIAGETQLHPVHNKGSYLSQSELTSHIGMGDAPQGRHARDHLERRPDHHPRVRVREPGDHRQRLPPRRPERGRDHRLRGPQPLRRRVQRLGPERGLQRRRHRRLRGPQRLRRRLQRPLPLIPRPRP